MMSRGEAGTESCGAGALGKHALVVKMMDE